ncbi:hypothetical protein P691DRAFT_803401 [Macrolepiota fuliginosa MF-IS2]|uniref:Vps72/YL1 C-terminal domain-containing protein n=1 Tax=Macrolepiota fuliginosa MF-IS2 TaxID=1400762 RepID=A0A9P5XAL3_9AGAR|nr:hypothetical protein P691DRAFT_803401 [Macrolepiota fuliginosa MF-IS2]
MEAALAEMALEESKDLDDDNEFVNDKDEEDVFESDFASTDEEADEDDLEAGEKAIHDEEKSARRATRSRLEKQTAVAHAKHKATFNPQAVAPPAAKPKPKSQPRRLSMFNDEIDGQDIPRRAGQKRKSQRRHTILNTSATVTRLKKSEEKKASAPKKFKPTIRAYSQAELIQRALDNEEGNIKEHKNYLIVEEEKRKKARAIKMPAVEGPLLRWISKIEDEKFKVNVEVPPPQPQTPAVPSYANYHLYYSQIYQMLAAQQAAATASNTAAQAQAGSSTQPGQTLTSHLATVTTAPATAAPSSTPSTSTTPSTTAIQAAAATFSTFRLPTATTSATYPFGYYTPASTSTSAAATTSPAFHSSFFTPTTIPAPAQPVQKQYVEEERTQKVTKNYVVHELGQRDGITKPPWKDMMKAMFGDHVKWEELKALSGKGRPLGRVKQRCPITGQIAPYLDPRTGVPFADVEAYKVLTDILEHRYVWSPELGCYVGRDDEG